MIDCSLVFHEKLDIGPDELIFFQKQLDFEGLEVLIFELELDVYRGLVVVFVGEEDSGEDDDAFLFDVFDDGFELEQNLL